MSELREAAEQAKALLIVNKFAPPVHDFERRKLEAHRDAVIDRLDAAIRSQAVSADYDQLTYWKDQAELWKAEAERLRSQAQITSSQAEEIKRLAAICNAYAEKIEALSAALRATPATAD